MGNFNFSVSPAMWGVPSLVDRGPCLGGKPVLQAKAAPLEQNLKVIGKGNQSGKKLLFLPFLLGLRWTGSPPRVR